MINVLSNKDTSFDNNGMVFNVQRYSIHDGSGIRTIIFLKGCPLRCKWCSNPESQKRTRELMFSHSKCIQCGTCVNSCPQEALRLGENGVVINDPAKCNLCGECVERCPTRSIKYVGDCLTVSKVMEEAVKDEIFFYASNGGITISGGEPLYQPEFLKALLDACQHRGIHTAIETCGVAENDVFSEVLEMVDHVLMDLKHVDDDKHVKWTGGSCGPILRNWETAANRKKQITCRIPVIPGFNDTEREIREMSSYIGSLGIKEIHLLAYHNFGESKYDGLGRSYPMGKAPGISADNMLMFQRIAGEYVDHVQIGG